MARKKHGLMGEVNLLGLDQFGQNPGMSPITGALIGGGVANVTSLAIGNMNAFQNMVGPNGMPVAQDRHFWGFMAGLATTGILWLTGPDRARHASWGALVGAILAEGLPWLEKFVLGTVEMPAPVAQVAAAITAAAPAVAQAAQSAATTGAPVTVPVTVPAPGAPGTSGMGMARIHALNGLRGLGIHRVHALNGLGMRRQGGGQYLNGLGLATVQPTSQSVGTIPGVHGPAFAGTQIGNAPPVNLLGPKTSQGTQVQLLGGPQIHGLASAYGATLLGGGRG